MPSPSREQQSAIDQYNQYKSQSEMSGFKKYIGYDNLSADEKKFADNYLSGQDFSKWNSGWYEEYAGKFQEELQKNRISSTSSQLKDINSTFNQDLFNRIKRVNQPDSYQNSLLYNAMGLGPKSSAFLAASANKEQTAKANENTYNQFSQAYEAGVGTAINADTSLLNITANQNTALAQLRQQKDLANQERNSQLWNSIFKTVVGVGTTLLAPYLAPAVVAGSVKQDYSGGSPTDPSYNPFKVQ